MANASPSPSSPINGSVAIAPLVPVFLGILQARSQVIADRKRQIQTDLRYNPREVGDQGDNASDAANRDRMHGELARLAKEEIRVRAALNRIHVGTFGVCADTDCGEAIDHARLESNPCAVFCRDCALSRDPGEKLPKLPPGCRRRS